MNKIAAFFLPFLLIASTVFAQSGKTQAIEYDDFILHNGRTAAHNGSFVSVDRSNSVGFDVSITGTAEVVFRVSGAGRFGWQTFSCFPSNSETPVTSTTASGFFQCNVSGADVVSARLDSCTDCSVTVIARRTTAILASGSGGGAGGPASELVFDDEFPGSPSEGDIIVITDDSVTGACDSSAGSAITLCYYNGSAWVALNIVAEADTLQTVFARGKEITGANSLANAFRFGDGVTPICGYTDGTLGPVIRPCTDANTRTYIWTNFTWCLYDVEGTSTIFCIDPDASTPNAMYPFTAGYRPRKSIFFTADAFYMQGCTLTTTSALVTAGLTEPYITCGDNNAHGFHRTFAMPDSWDGGTVTFTVYAINVNAAPADNYEIDFSGACLANSDAMATTISTTGEQPANIGFDNTETCGTACAQFDVAKVTTSAVTLNGTPAGGNLCRIQGQIDATATTTAQVADVKIIGVMLEYTISSLSD